MADPLAELADRTVPERTNFFNPADAQTIMSRYANARRGAETSELVARSAERNLRAQREAELLDRQRVTWDRDDEDYYAKKDALKQRGDFIRQMGQQLDPRSPDYNRQVTEFVSGLPQELAEDETIKGVLASMNAEADDFRSNERLRESKEQSLRNAMTLNDQRAGFRFKFLKPEDYERNTTQDGTVDWRTLNAIDAERERAYKEGEFSRKENLRTSNRLRLVDARDLSKRGRERRGNIQKFLVEDRAAFPPRFENEVLNEYRKSKGLGAEDKVNTVSLEASPEWEPKLAAARKKDADPLENELSAAFAYDDPDDYVNLISGLSESQKERRRAVWEHAHRDDAVEEIEGTSPAAPASAQPQAPAFQRTKTINGKTYGFDGKGWKQIGG